MMASFARRDEAIGSFVPRRSARAFDQGASAKTSSCHRLAINHDGTNRQFFVPTHNDCSDRRFHLVQFDQDVPSCHLSIQTSSTTQSGVDRARDSMNSIPLEKGSESTLN